MSDWSLTPLKEKPIKIGAKVVNIRIPHPPNGRYDGHHKQVEIAL
jgi:hypothetical protein